MTDLPICIRREYHARRPTIQLLIWRYADALVAQRISLTTGDLRRYARFAPDALDAANAWVDAELLR